MALVHFHGGGFARGSQEALAAHVMPLPARGYVSMLTTCDLTKRLQQLIETTIKREARFVAFTQTSGGGDSGGEPVCLGPESAYYRLHPAGMGHLNAIKQESGDGGDRSEI